MTTGDETARIFGDRYVLGERLTASDTREVWRAHDDVVSRAIALKIFFGPQVADPDWQTGFRRDAARLAALSHPGIAKVYEHDESADEAWLAMAFIDGQPASDRVDQSPPLPAAEALDIVGQTALALKAAHDVGIAHGNLGVDNMLIRPEGAVALIGFSVGGHASQADDLRALGVLAERCLRPSRESHPPEVVDFVDWLINPDRAQPPRDAAEVGRTALALASSVSGTHTTTVVPRATAPTAMDDTAGAPPRYDEAERKMVRNRLIVLGTIVVVGGAALLRFVGEGGGDVPVPSVVNLPIDQAKLALTRAGLRPSEACVVGKDSGNTVVTQSPVAGQQVKAGSSITLTLSQANC
jgi:tRNA A-37 threonylcarbamoyl transferase component Bud32